MYAPPRSIAAGIRALRALLVHTYSSALSTYRDEGIEYKPLRFAPGDTDAAQRSRPQGPLAPVLLLRLVRERL